MASTPVIKVEEGEGVSIAASVTGLLDHLRVAVAAPHAGDTRASKAVAQLTAQATERASADVIYAAVSKGDFQAALDALPKLEASVLDNDVRSRATALRHDIEGRVLGDLALRYSDSLVAIRRFAFVENIITPSRT